MPESVSTFGGDIDSIIRLIFYIVGAWFVAVEVLIVYFAIRYRRRGPRQAAYLKGDSWQQASWVLIPVAIVLVLDLGLDVAGHAAWETEKLTLPTAQYEVGVSAKQFNWEFVYPGPDGKLGTEDDVTIENELHVPVGKVVRLELSSKDVLHSFSVPNFRLRQDVVPGRVIRAWFQADKPGTYEIQCTELCGFGHYTMHGNVFVQTQQDYDNWKRDNLKPASAAGAQ